MDFRKRTSKQNPNKDWLDWWLSDDSPPPSVQQELRRAKVQRANSYKPRVQATSVTETTQTSAPTNVTININFSKLKLPKVKKPNFIRALQLPYRRIVTVLVALIVGLVVVSSLYNHLH